MTNICSIILRIIVVMIEIPGLVSAGSGYISEPNKEPAIPSR